MSEYALTLPSNVSLDDLDGVIVKYEAKSARKQRFIRLTKVWITGVADGRLVRAQFNLPIDAASDLLPPETEFTMLRACKMLNRETAHQLIKLYAGSGYLCSDAGMDRAIHEDESVDWEQLHAASLSHEQVATVSSASPQTSG